MPSAALLGYADESHPTWVRGLKRGTNLNYFGTDGSHPTWVRGLKLFYLVLADLKI